MLDRDVVFKVVSLNAVISQIYICCLEVEQSLVVAIVLQCIDVCIIQQTYFQPRSKMPIYVRVGRWKLGKFATYVV